MGDDFGHALEEWVHEAALNEKTSPDELLKLQDDIFLNFGISPEIQEIKDAIQQVIHRTSQLKRTNL